MDWGVHSLCLPFLGFAGHCHMAGFVTVVALFLEKRTTFMIVIFQTAVATLINRLFRGWQTLCSKGFTSFLGLDFLLGFYLHNKSTGFDYLPLESFNILVRLLNSYALRYHIVQCQFL